ncbi:hypothetical protein ABPG73_006891 [Tetrahymena malaccensis]
MLLPITSVNSQNCQNLLQQLPSPKSYQGYQCVLDSENNFTTSSISRKYIRVQTSQYTDIQFAQGSCSEQILMNPNYIQQLNDIYIDFNGSQGQIIAYAQISFDSDFNLQNGNYPTVIGILAYDNNGHNYLFTEVQINQQNSQQKCQNNYYKSSEYQLIPLSPDTSQFTFQTYHHPGNIPNIMSNIQLMVYFKCPIGCSQCSNTGNCSACVPNYTLKNNYCYLNCNSNQYAIITDLNSTEQICQLCDPSCLTCFGSSTTCTSCANSYFLNNNQQCQQCDQSCLNCIGDSKSCTVCSNSYYPLITGLQQSAYQCFQTCPNNYFLINNQCQQCDQSCLTCTGNSYNCTQCANTYFALYSSPTDQTFRCYQICPNGYNLQQNQCQICLQFSSIVCQNCAATCRSCQKGQTNNCMDCYQTMNLNGSTCVCKNNQDQRNSFYQCSYDNYAVVQGTFDGSSPTLILEFGSQLVQINNLLCNQVFDSSTLNLLGTNSICKISSTQIIVSLSNDAIIMVNSTISFNTQAKVLQFQGYQNPIDTFFLTQVVQQQVAIPSVNIQYNNVVNSCDDIIFQIQNVQNDAKRGFLQLQWSVTPTQNFDDLTIQNINSLIQTANSQQSQTLVISKYIIPPNSSISIDLQYTLKVYQSNTLTFTTYNQKSKQVIIQSIQNKYPPIYRYMGLQFIFSFFVQICDQSGANITQEPLDVQITSNNMPSLSQTQNQFTGQQIEIDVKPYSIPQMIKPLIQNASDKVNLNSSQKLQLPFNNIKQSKYNLSCIQQQDLSSKPSQIVFPLPQQLKEVQLLQKSNQYQENQSPTLFPSPLLFQAKSQNIGNLIQQDLVLESQTIAQSNFQNQLDKEANDIINWNTPQNTKSIFFSINKIKQQEGLNSQHSETINDCKINQNIFENINNQKRQENDQENKQVIQKDNQNTGDIIKNKSEDQIVKEEDTEALKDKETSVISGQPEQNSNKKISSFFIMFGFDFVAISTLNSIISILIFTLVARQNKNKLVLKMYNLLSIKDKLQRLDL